MNKDNNFFDRLYKGYAAENFVTAQLFENGFEAFRLPGDFGIDLVVTNQFKTLDDKKISDNSFPFGLQVKSRRLKDSHRKDSVNGRHEYQFDYKLKREEIKTLKEFSNSAYIFVFTVPHGFSIKSTYTICIHSNQIDDMIENGLFIKKDGEYLLNVCFRSMPQYSRKDFISEMLDQKIIDKNGVKFLEKNLPDYFQKNWNASEGFYLAQENFGYKKSIRDYDFSEFPDFSKSIFL